MNMNNLGNWIAEQLITENNIKTVIAIYPGRFQPMGPHHVKTYNWLAKQFGKDNTFVVTSDKVKLPKSPLSFKEKQSIINKQGIKNVVQVRNPYQSAELLKDFDPETTAAVFMVGEKDAQRLGGKFFRPWEGVANIGYRDGAYTLIAPHVSLNVPGFGEMSGTTIRQALANADESMFKDIMGFYDRKIHQTVLDKFKDIQQETIGNFLLKYPINEVSINSIGSNTDVDDGPRYFYGSQNAYEQSSKKMAESLGYSVINYIMDGGMSEIGNTNFPDGPPLGVSYFPVGDAGSSMAGTDYTGNIKGKPAYKKWQSYIKNIATNVGYNFLDFLGAEDAIDSTKNDPMKPEVLVQEQVLTKDWWSSIMEDITVPVNIGDTVLMGKFKNKKVVVKSITKNEKGDILINGRPAFKFRLMPVQENTLNEINIKGYIKKVSDKFQKFLKNLKQEGKETKEAFALLLKSLDGEPLTKQQKTQIGDQFKDVLRTIGLTAAAILPGASIYLILAQTTRLKKHLLPSAFIESLQENILTEASANTHLTHLEELLITQGAQGYKLAKSFLLELIRNLKGNSNAKVNTSVKWDGAPAIFTGINPDNGKFFVGTKSVFNKEPKINYTKEDIELNHGHAPGLADKLIKALEYFPSLGIKNILQGDFMFDKESVKTQSIDGKPHYVFKPNTITYAVDADSELGKQIARSKIGIVFHTTYKDLQSGASYGADVSGLRENPNVWFDDAFFKDTTGTVLLTNDEAKEVLSKIKQADSIKVNYNELPSALLNVYVNSEIKTNRFLEDPEKSYESFVEWTQGKTNKRIEKLKSVRGKEKATLAGQEQRANIEARKQDIINLFRVSKLFADAKMIFVNKYNAAIYKTKHFVDDGQGGLKVTAPEGYVAVDHIGNGVKLVDRLEFSRANFAMDKGFTK
jgi:hypothetical protein